MRSAIDIFAARLVRKTALYLALFTLLLWLAAIPLRHGMLVEAGIKPLDISFEIVSVIAWSGLTFLLVWGMGSLAARSVKRRALKAERPQ